MTTQQFDEAGYKLRQRQEWDSVAVAWKKWWPFFERGTQQVNVRLAELAGIQAGHRVLDISTGIGEPAVTVARLVGSAGSVVATDQSPGMLAVAQERIDELGLRNVELLEMDTEALEVTQEEFDSVVCRWGLMFLPDLNQALTRIYRSLKPGARFATSVWAMPDKAPFLSMPMGIAQKVLQPPPPPPPPDAPNLFKLGAPGLIESEFEKAGFRDVRSSVLTLQLEIASPDEYVDFMRDIAPPIRALVSERTPQEQDTFWNAIRQGAQGFASADGSVNIPSDTILVVGSR